MKVTSRQLQGEEMLDALYFLNSYSLLPSPPFQNKEEFQAVDRGRQGITCFTIFEDEHPVSIAVSTPQTQNMRGKLFPASGIWGVSTLPAARRKGYCKRIMASLLSADRDLGRVFSNLYPFRESFYERMGYVSFPLTKIAKCTTLNLATMLSMDLGGEIRLQYIGEAYDTYREYLAVMRKDTHGMTVFDHGDKTQAAKNLIWVAFAEFNGDIEGLMLYKILGEEVSKYNFVAMRFYYRTSRARYLLLNWIARHIDQADRLELSLSENEYPETWLADIQVKIETPVRAAMSRVLDVEQIAGMEVGEGNFSASITDPLCPWNDGMWHFESIGQKLRVTKSSSADCVLTIQGLSTLIAGTHDPSEFPLRGWGDVNPVIQSTLQRMFPKMRPYMHEIF